MPDLVCSLAQRYALQLMPSARIKNAQLDFVGVGGEHREVDAFAVPGRAARVGLAGPNRPDGPGVTLAGRGFCQRGLLVHRTSGSYCVKALRLRNGMLAQSGRLPSS